jgi:hypothetical protein
VDGVAGVAEDSAVGVVPLPQAATSSTEVRTPSAALTLTLTIRGRARLWIDGRRALMPLLRFGLPPPAFLLSRKFVDFLRIEGDLLICGQSVKPIASNRGRSDLCAPRPQIRVPPESFQGRCGRLARECAFGSRYVRRAAVDSNHVPPAAVEAFQANHARSAKADAPHRAIGAGGASGMGATPAAQHHRLSLRCLVATPRNPARTQKHSHPQKEPITPTCGTPPFRSPQYGLGHPNRRSGGLSRQTNPFGVGRLITVNRSPIVSYITRRTDRARQLLHRRRTALFARELAIACPRCGQSEPSLGRPAAPEVSLLPRALAV